MLEYYSLTPSFNRVIAMPCRNKTVSTVCPRFEETVETVLRIASCQSTQLKLGVNEIRQF
jgi:hypothetical protein